MTGHWRILSYTIIVQTSGRSPPPPPGPPGRPPPGRGWTGLLHISLISIELYRDLTDGLQYLELLFFFPKIFLYCALDGKTLTNLPKFGDMKSFYLKSSQVIKKRSDQHKNTGLQIQNQSSTSDITVIHFKNLVIWIFNFQTSNTFLSLNIEGEKLCHSFPNLVKMYRIEKIDAK